jgi:serine/threonine protein kinase
VPSIEDELGGLNSKPRRDLRECASQLKKMLLSGADFIDLRELLPPAEVPHRRSVLHELIKTELEARYARGQGRPLEEFLRQYPELGACEDLPADLVYEEYRVRWLFGDRPALETYRARFPLQFEEVQRRVNLHGPSDPPPEVRPPSDSRTTGPSLTYPSDPLASTRTAPPSAPAPSEGSLSQSVPGGEGYQLLERIGRGAYGDVYRALAPGGVVVAVKRIFRSVDDESSQRELKAMEKIRELRHPFLLQTHSFRAFEDRLLIAMELADGSLEDRLKECRAAGLPGIPKEELLPYFSEAAEAIDFLHQQRLSHRDIKPQNLLHLKGHAKVADFGIARTQQNALDHTLHSAGTPAYMPPEMWRGNISVHSDQYSFALTWYEMRTGRRAFSATSQLDLLQQHATGKPDVSAVPLAEQRVLQRALAKEPDQRYLSCVAFVEALKEATAHAKPEFSRDGRGVKIVVWPLAIVLSAMVVVLGVQWLSQRQSRQVGSPEPLPQVSWRLQDWDPEDARAIERDSRGHYYYSRLVRWVGAEKVVMVLVRQTAPTDPRTFYAMENKVWNNLIATFMADPEAQRLMLRYSSRPGCRQLVRGEWQKGGFATNAPNFGVGPDKGDLPVFRVRVTEAHCFAEWLGGLLPTRQQWRKAAGWEEGGRLGPFSGDPQNPDGLALGLSDGPKPVSWGQRDVSIYGCRQMASNGYEWTRDLADEGPGGKTIPLEHMTAARSVVVEGQSYLTAEPLTSFREMADNRISVKCIEAHNDITFRIVLEQ